MVRVVGGVVTSALLVLGLASCSSESGPDTTVDASENVAVEPEEVVRHEAASGTPISFGIDVPDGAVQVGPLIRQRRLEVEEVIEDPGGRADAFGNDENADEPEPETHDPEEPAPPDFTTALLRVDDDPSEVLQNTFEEIEDALPESEIDPEKWVDHCAVADGVYTGCEVEFSGTTEDDEHIAVELTVDPGRPKSKVAPAGSLLRPVMALTIEQQTPPPDDEDGSDGDDPDQNDGSGKGDDPGRSDKRGRSENSARDARNEIDSPRADKDRRRADNDRRDNDRRGNDRRDNEPTRGDDETPDEDSGEQDSDKDSEDAEPTWPTMNKERPAEPGDKILTPRWKIQPNTEVILSTMSPKVAMLAVKDGADADAIARRYIRAFADEATTPKIDEVEDRNERSITYTPRNDGTGPSVAVTAVATGRGNYIELLFSADPTDKVETHPRDGKAADRKAKKGTKGKPRHSRAAKRTNSSTG